MGAGVAASLPFLPYGQLQRTSQGTVWQGSGKTVPVKTVADLEALGVSMVQPEPWHLVRTAQAPVPLRQVFQVRASGRCSPQAHARVSMW